MTTPTAMHALQAANPVPAVDTDPAAAERGWLALAARVPDPPTQPIRTRRRRVLRSTVVPTVALLALTTAGTALATGANPMRLFTAAPSGEDQVEAAAAVVSAYSAAHPRSGYSSMSADGAHRTLTVWWHGPVPAELRASLVRRTPVRVVYAPARYPATVLMEASRQLALAVRMGAFVRYGVSGAATGPALDGSGLNFMYEAYPASADQIRAAVQQLTGVPVTHLSYIGAFHYTSVIDPATPRPSP